MHASATKPEKYLWPPELWTNQRGIGHEPRDALFENRQPARSRAP